MTDDTEFIDITYLSAAIAEAIRPFAGEKARFVTGRQIKAWLAEATELMAARERFARQQTLAADWQCELMLVEARNAYLIGLTGEERALLELRLRAKAEADARAVHACEQMAAEIEALKNELANTRRRLAALNALDHLRRHSSSSGVGSFYGSD